MPDFPLPPGETEQSLLRAEVWRGLGQRFPGGYDDRAPAAGRVRAGHYRGHRVLLLLPGRRRPGRLGAGARRPGRPRPRLGGRLAGRVRAGHHRAGPGQHGLVFERFLNPERVSMPDIDIDFDERGRGEVIRYVTRRYGDDRVAQIVTFGTIKAKAAVKDSARVLGLPVLGRRPDHQGDPAAGAGPGHAAGRRCSSRAARATARRARSAPCTRPSRRCARSSRPRAGWRG